MKRTAIAVCAYGRPAYFVRVVASLRTQSLGINDWPIFFFLDGGENSKQEELARIISEAKFPHAHIIAQDRNLGCERSLILSHEELFDRHRFDRVVNFEDDMVLAPHYLRVLNALANWTSHRYRNVGAVQCWYPCHLNVDDKRRLLHAAVSGNPHWWGYAMERWAWNRTRAMLFEFRDRLLPADDTKRPHDLIRQYMRQQLAKALPPPRFRAWPQRWQENGYFTAPDVATGSDAITALAFYVAGLVKISTLVNRSLPIGEVGVHSTSNFFHQVGFDQITLENFSEDADPLPFHATDSGGISVEPSRLRDKVRLAVTSPSLAARKLAKRLRLT